jgi:hypothetical protein
MSFLQHFLHVRYWYWFGERCLSPNQYQYLTCRILHKVQRGSLSSPWQLPPRLLRHQESLLLPTRYVQFLLDHYIVYIAKSLVVFAPKFTKKSPFLNARLVRGILSTVSFFLQTSTTRAIRAYGNNCFLCCVHCKKTDCCCSQSCREKSFLECAACFVGCVVFPSNEYNDGHPCLWQ